MPGQKNQFNCKYKNDRSQAKLAQLQFGHLPY